MTDKHCGNCKYCGEVLKDNLHSCNNSKSIFNACLETATGCEKFEPTQKSVENTLKTRCEDTVSRQAVIDEIRFGQSYITKISSTGEVENLFVNENRALEDAVDRVMALPSVQPKGETE